MATKKITDFVKQVQQAMEECKPMEPVERVTSMADKLNERAENRIAALEENRKVYNANIDKAIADERSAIKNIFLQTKNIKEPDENDYKKTAETKTRKTKKAKPKKTR